VVSAADPLRRNNVGDGAGCLARMLVVGYGIVRTISVGFENLLQYCCAIKERNPEDSIQTADRITSK
jgi:hypothetical protein